MSEQACSSCNRNWNILSRRNFLNFFFRRFTVDCNVESFISSEGLITENAWNGMNKTSHWKVRLNTIKNLEDIAKNRRLHVSILESIWAETHDMLEIEKLRNSFLSVMCSLTRTQSDEIGQALRLTFFETIKKIGFDKLTFQWLVALTANGQNIKPFEYFIGELVVNWLTIAYNDPKSSPSCQDALKLTQLIERILIHNSAFIRNVQLKQITNSFCKKICGNQNSLIKPILLCLEAILKYSHVPKIELLSLVVSLCYLLSNPLYRQVTWRLLRFFLSSGNAYSILRILQAILTSFFDLNIEEIPIKARIAIVRGAVFCVSMAMWGSQRIDSLRCSSSVVVPSLTEAMVLDPLIAREVLLAIRRLVEKFGNSIQQLTWMCINQLLERAIKYVKINRISESSETFVDLIQIILMIENLYLQNEFCGSVDSFFTIVEMCSSNLPNETVFRLIDYRVSCIDPLTANWIPQMLYLIQSYISVTNSSQHCEKALSIASSVYHKYRLMYETILVRNFLLPICAKIFDEYNPSFQYQLIIFLSDLIKSISLRFNNKLFSEVVYLIRKILNSNISHIARNDNLEIMICSIVEILNDRWSSFSGESIEIIITVLFEHLQLHYVNGYKGVIGSNLRVRVFEALLYIQMDTTSQRLTRVIQSSASPRQTCRIINSLLIVGTLSFDTTFSSPILCCVEFKWNLICEATSYALRTEQSWPVLNKILECLSSILEFRLLVYSAGDARVSQLAGSIVNLYNRFDGRQLILVENDEFSKYICPVIVKLINYEQDIKLCKILVECAKFGCVQAIICCNLAVQILPEKMASLSCQLMDYLLKLKPNTQLAIAIIEFIGDSADVIKFHEFFQEKQFKMIVDILVPYTNAANFNVFIISSIFNVLMRWFVRISETFRPEFSQYILKTLASVNDVNVKTLNVAPHLSASTQRTDVYFQPLSPRNVLLKYSKQHKDSKTPKKLSTKYHEGSLQIEKIQRRDISPAFVTKTKLPGRPSTAPITSISSDSLFGPSSFKNTLFIATSPTGPTILKSDIIWYSDSKFVGESSTKSASCTMQNGVTLTAMNGAMSVASDKLNGKMNPSSSMESTHFRQDGISQSTVRSANVYGVSPQISEDGHQLSIFSVGSPSLTSEVSPTLELWHRGCNSSGLSPIFASVTNTAATEDLACRLNINDKDLQLDLRVLNDTSIVQSFVRSNRNISNAVQTDWNSFREDDLHNGTSVDHCELITEMIEMLRLFMRFRRKRDAIANIFSLEDRQKNANVLMGSCFLNENGNSLICEQSIEHWIIGHSIFTVRLLHKCESLTKYFFLPPEEKLHSTLDKNSKDISDLDIKPNAPVLIVNKSNKDCNFVQYLDVAGPIKFSSKIASTKKCFSSLSTDNLQSPKKIRHRNFSSVQSKRQFVPLVNILPCKTSEAEPITASHKTIAMNRSDVDLPNSSSVTSFVVEYVNLIVRHPFGKESWVMRSFEKIPIDFGVESFPISDVSSLILHLFGASRDGMDVLKIPAVNHDAAQRSLRILDKVDAEELHVVGVLYIGEEQSHETEILANQYGSDRYMNFIKLLGDVVSLEDDPGGLQKGKHGKFTFEYSDPISKMVFLVATLMPNLDDDPKCNAKKSLIGNNFISIVFNESGNPYKLGTVSGQFDRVALEVVPHDEETVVITLHARREIARWLGMKSAFLFDAEAVNLLRKMVQRAQLSVNVWRNLEDIRQINKAGETVKVYPYLSQSVDRMRKICSLKEKGVPDIC